MITKKIGIVPCFAFSEHPPLNRFIFVVENGMKIYFFYLNNKYFGPGRLKLYMALVLILRDIPQFLPNLTLPKLSMPEKSLKKSFVFVNVPYLNNNISKKNAFKIL